VKLGAEETLGGGKCKEKAVGGVTGMKDRWPNLYY